MVTFGESICDDTPHVVELNDAQPGDSVVVVSSGEVIDEFVVNPTGEVPVVGHEPHVHDVSEPPEGY